MKVLIHGFYGAGNAGDDAILHVIINQLQSINKNVEVTVVIRSKQLKPYYGTANVNYILGLNFEEITKVLKESSLLIVGGGGLFQDYNESHPENLFHNQEGALNYYLAPIILAKMLNVKTMLYGVGIGPLSQEDSLKTMKWIADIVDAITVRDQDSFQILNSLGITKHVLSADPALQLRADCSNKDDIIPKDKRLKIGLNLRNWSYDKNNEQRFENILISTLNEMTDRLNPRYFIFPFNKLPSEIKKANELSQRLKGSVEVLNYNSSPASYKCICGQLDVMIAMRLHASIFSISEGVPSIGISYDQKVRQFYEEFGFDQYCLDLSNISRRLFKSLLDKTLKSREQYKSLMPKKKAEWSSREKNNQLTLMELLEGTEGE